MKFDEWFAWCGGNQSILNMINDIKLFTPYSDDNIIEAVNKIRFLGINLSLEEIVSFIWANETPYMKL